MKASFSRRLCLKTSRANRDSSTPGAGAPAGCSLNGGDSIRTQPARPSKFDAFPLAVDSAGRSASNFVMLKMRRSRSGTCTISSEPPPSASRLLIVMKRWRAAEVNEFNGGDIDHQTRRGSKNTPLRVRSTGSSRAPSRRPRLPQPGAGRRRVDSRGWCAATRGSGGGSSWLGPARANLPGLYALAFAPTSASRLPMVCIFLRAVFSSSRFSLSSVATSSSPIASAIVTRPSYAAIS